jgi:hypothetical protein
MYIYPLSITQAIINVYFGLDKRECGCLEYLTITLTHESWLLFIHREF